MPGFAVIDFETTGLFAGGSHRVIEVAVVHVSADGQTEGQWETLINPGRDLGRQDIHHVRAADVMQAPTFAEVAPQLVALLDGRVVVAHNAAFDLRFLLAELARAGYPVTEPVISLCTMQLARDFLPGTGRALADCCAAYDIDLIGAHRASVDTYATAQLLSHYITGAADPMLWADALDRAATYRWPTLPPAERAWYPRPQYATEQTASAFLERISVRLPEITGPAEHQDYLALLDRCLLDRQLSAHEAQALVQLAEELGLSRHRCELLHGEYFAALARIAWADGVLTTDEMADLVDVANLLDISADALDAALDCSEPAVVVVASAHFELHLGDLVVLTGEMMRPRSDWESELLARGFAPKSAVTKKVTLLVAADPDSLSGKARKARDYGIPIVGEAALARLAGAFPLR
ncbi:exonuclease domain-containing protein [Cryobacterium sp. PH31-O1]|uniref:exonuclease domain-containing protein n=1 Tax=Cryobacterium sp. PH31-O1 TaxID=3046306 RepID=UPI0024B8A426|nr:exonuclease domain-containing protein [Cryobacterium sp. PH31-O1]MDJ0339335.1 exonuclease domain-containing protein [Cryobacterium sp. PH31-O1]